MSKGGLDPIAVEAQAEKCNFAGKDSVGYTIFNLYGMCILMSLAKLSLVVYVD